MCLGQGRVRSIGERLMRSTGGGERAVPAKGATDGPDESSGCKLAVGNICPFVHLPHSVFTVRLVETH